MSKRKVICKRVSGSGDFDLRPAYIETGLSLIPDERLEKAGLELAIFGFQGECLNYYDTLISMETTISDISNMLRNCNVCFLFSLAAIPVFK